MIKIPIFSFLILILLFSCADNEDSTKLETLSVTSFKINGIESLAIQRIKDISRMPTFEITFSKPINPEYANAGFVDISGSQIFTYSLSADNSVLTLTATQPLAHLTRHIFWVSIEVKGMKGETMSDQLSKFFYTEVDPTPKFPVITDDELLTLVQQQTFKYFYDFAHPASGMARERNTSGDLVTSGGSGFGIMALIVGMERNFITRQQGLDRMDKILDFLEAANRFHGVWPHWMNGNTGNIIPFSTNDNGGDLVETAFLVQGLLTFRQYLDENVAAENDLIARINALWDAVEWDWYTQGGQSVLYWHWSPDKGWIMNHQIRGWNEALIIYVLAASSPTHTINQSVYSNGWARNGGIVNGNAYYGINLPLGSGYGGPLFFSHYSFLGLDPRNLSDAYANYWTQNVNHSKINRQHAIVNPNNFVAYSAQCWGLTASDGNNGYSAHSPTNDRGVITPTAALSSFPYTPEESMDALKFFYYTIGDRTWGTYGFYDAFNVTANWYASSTLAIDQGPIIVMIENHRTGLLWDLFMSCPEIQNGLTNLGFTY